MYPRSSVLYPLSSLLFGLGFLFFLSSVPCSFSQGQPTAKKTQSAKPAPPPPPVKNPAAAKAVEDAVARLKQYKWIQTSLWQQGNLQGLSFRAEGNYVLGPEHRLHLQLKAYLADMRADLEVVCDGKTLYETMKVGDQERVVTRKVDIHKVVNDALNAPGIAPEVREAFFSNQFFSGVVPLLETLQQQLVFTKKEEVHWRAAVPSGERSRAEGEALVQITGVWSADMVKAYGIPEQAPFFPRECRIFLDSKTGWPYRLEWWGLAPPRSRDSLLLQMEFRQPKLDQPLSAAQSAAEFTFKTPVTGKIPDLTDAEIENVKRHAQMISNRKRQAR